MATTQKADGRLLQFKDREDRVSGPAQSVISKIPSDTFLILSVGSIIGSATLRYLGKKDSSLFVGQWAPTFAILGVFDKLVRSK